MPPGEFDYLSFHMGMKFLRNLEQRDLVTITLVVPRVSIMATSVSSQLQDSNRGQAVVEQTITTIDHDFSDGSSDLIVSRSSGTSWTRSPASCRSARTSPHW